MNQAPTEMGALVALHQALTKYCLDEERFEVVAAYLVQEYPLDIQTIQAQAWSFGTLADYCDAPEFRPEGPKPHQKDRAYRDELAFKFDDRFLTLIGGLEDEAALYGRMNKAMRRWLLGDNMGYRYTRINVLPAELPIIDDLSKETQKAALETVDLIRMHVQASLLERDTNLVFHSPIVARL